MVRRNARSWETATTVPSKSVERLLQRLGGLDVEVVGRLVEQQQVVTLELQHEHLEPRLLATAQHVVGPAGGVGQPVAGQRAHRSLDATATDAVEHDVDHDPARRGRSRD